MSFIVTDILLSRPFLNPIYCNNIHRDKSLDYVKQWLSFAVALVP